MKSSALLPSNLPSVDDTRQITRQYCTAFHFYFYSNNDPTNILFVKEWQPEILTAYGKPWLTASKFYRANNAPFVSVDLIGEKKQVILE